MADNATALNTQAEVLAAAKLKVAQREQGIRAQAYGEGRKAERNEILATVGAKAVEDIALAPTLIRRHKEEMAEAVHEARARGFWKAVGICGPVLLFVFVMGLLCGVYIQREGWAMRVSDERIPRASVPAITDEYEEPGYERHPREPGSAN